MGSAPSPHEVLSVLASHLPEIRDRFAVSQLSIFGSVARGEGKQGSDVDVLVDFRPDARVGFFEFLELEQYLSGILGRPVDLVTRAALKPRIGRRIVGELIPV